MDGIELESLNLKLSASVTTFATIEHQLWSDSAIGIGDTDDNIIARSFIIIICLFVVL